MRNSCKKAYGVLTKAPYDGRHSWDITNVGIGQSEGKERNGITALLNSVAGCDPDAYKNKRVRVSGFSDYFVLLNDAL